MQWKDGGMALPKKVKFINKAFFHGVFQGD